MNIKVSAKEYLFRLKMYKSYLKRYRRKVMPWDWNNIEEIENHTIFSLAKYRNLIGMMSILQRKTIPIFFVDGRPIHVVDKIDRMIIGQNLVLQVSNEDVSVMHKFGDKNHPLMPLSDYIYYLEDGIKFGSLRRATYILDEGRVASSISAHTNPSVKVAFTDHGYEEIVPLSTLDYKTGQMSQQVYETAVHIYNLIEERSILYGKNRKTSQPSTE